MPKALHRHPSKRRRTAREKKRPWTTEPQPTASRKHKYPGAHVERRGRMRTTQITEIWEDASRGEQAQAP